MVNTTKNISFSLQEGSREENPPTYEELLHEVDLMEISSGLFMDDYIAQEVDYQTKLFPQGIR